MTINARDFDRLVTVLGFATRNAGDRLAWFTYEGKIVVRTKRSFQSSGDLPFQENIRQQMHLTDDELRDFLRGRRNRDDYIALLRRKGII